MTTAAEVREALVAASDSARATDHQRFFKTAEGEYGAGDVFVGVTVPAIRTVVKQSKSLDPAGFDELVNSEVHEFRMAGLLILVAQYPRADEAEKARIVERYLAALKRGRINNWDLVDCSAEYIVGEHLVNRPRDLLFELAASDDLWDRRVAVLSSFAFIKRADATTTLALAELLIDDKRDLIQKAVGWMLREVGKRVDRALLVEFLDRHAAQMPRTMLSYAVERLEPETRAHYRGLR